MKYGKIRIEDGNLIFSKHMMMNYLPCKDILWAYKRKEGVEGGAQKQFSTSSLVIITRRKKRYQFDLTDREIESAESEYCDRISERWQNPAPESAEYKRSGGTDDIRRTPYSSTQTSPKRNTVSYFNRRSGHLDKRLSSDDCD